MLAGEIIRLESYANSGLIEIDKPVPDPLLQAARHLRDAGFDGRAETATPVAALSLSSPPS